MDKQHHITSLAYVLAVHKHTIDINVTSKTDQHENPKGQCQYIVAIQ